MDVYSMVAQRIISELEKGIVPWHKPWSTTAGAISHCTGKPYSLLNQMLLGGQCGEYLTFQQAQKEGGHVRKGEKGNIIVFYKFLTSIDEETGEVTEIPYLKYITVFHTSQCEGIKPRFIASQPELHPIAAHEAAETIIKDYVARSGVHLTHCSGNRAFYRPATDEVVLPLREQFSSSPGYYSTAFHELVHSTGHPSRLNRLTQNASFGSDVYSKEELCAELGASYLVHHIGLETTQSFQNNAAYIDHWLKVLKEDKRFLVHAAGRADKTVRLILNEEEPSDVH